MLPLDSARGDIVGKFFACEAAVVEAVDHGIECYVWQHEVVTHTHPDYIATKWALSKSDSLFNIVQAKVKQSDLLLLQKDSTIAAYKTREAQHQVNNYEISKQLNTYRKEHRVCFKTNFWGKTEEVPCSEVFK